MTHWQRHLRTTTITTGGRSTLAGKVTCYGLEFSSTESLWGRDFPHPSKEFLRPTQSPVQWIPWFFPEVKRLERGGKNSSHLAPSLKKVQSYTSTLPGAFMTCSSVSFTFSFYCYHSVNIANNNDDNNNNNNSVKFCFCLLMDFHITWPRTERTLMRMIKTMLMIIVIVIQSLPKSFHDHDICNKVLLTFILRA
jgi:hypothetical protein